MVNAIWPVLFSAMINLVKAIDTHDAPAPGVGQAVLADLADWLVGMDDGFASADAEVLRITTEFHQDDIAGLHIRDAGNAGLVVEGGFEQAIAGQAGIAAVVDVFQA